MQLQYAIINTNDMNIDDKVKVDRILAQADILVPDSSPELLGAVGLSQYTLYAQRGWHSERGLIMAERQLEETFHKSLCVFLVAMGV